ncbi:MAG: hypothetical protein HKN00_11205 [Flavobacteriaceae bacterium]|nr:hypothetical protein [Bacteroidia bacterium]NNF75745.1 hypothetical protein [Flavobacteriaceae bacterium]
MENKTSKYFKYAIGEILLVVIGILIALQINNWNEKRKLSIKESVYLNDLKIDLQQSQKSLNRVIKKSKRVAKTVDTLADLIKKNGDKLTPFEIDSLTGSVSGFTVFMPSEGVINDIIGSGKLDMIKDDKLRSKIASWEADLRMIREYERLSKETSEKYLDHISKYFDMINGKYGQPGFFNELRTEFLNDHIMTNHMVDIFGNSMTLNDLYDQKLQELDTLISIIDSELE